MDDPNTPVPPTRLHIDKRAATLAEQGRAAGTADKWFDTPGLAQWLGVSKQFLELRRKLGDGPPFFRPSPNMVRYRLGEVVEWLNRRHHQRTSEYANEQSARSRPRGRQKGSKIIDGKVIPPDVAEAPAARLQRPRR